MDIKKLVEKLLGKGDEAELLYLSLVRDVITGHLVEYQEMGENMTIVKEVLSDYWTPRFLMDNKVRRAYELIDAQGRYVTLTTDDIRSLNLPYPPVICKFLNGIAEISWQLDPEKCLYGFINKKGEIITKIKAVKDHKELMAMRKEAVNRVFLNI